MKQELDTALCTKYPKIFAERHVDMTASAMCWGFEHSDGWYDILDIMCSEIQNYTDWQNKSVAAGYASAHAVPQVVAMQVKEKFGTLNFYHSGGDAYIRGVVTMAERLSARVCEQCGQPGKRRTGGWIKTLCDAHARPSDLDALDAEENTF